MTTEIKATVRISDTLQVTRYEQGNMNRVVIRTKNEFEGTTATVSVYEREDAISLAKELMYWANSQGISYEAEQS